MLLGNYHDIIGVNKKTDKNEKGEKMKKIATLSALVAALLLGGCGNQDTSCRIDVQKDIDKGNFDSAISKLNGSCATAFNENDRLYNLATAYMGKAGYGVSDVIKVMVEADDNNNNDSFTTFAKSISKNKKADSLNLLSQAKEYFLRSLKPNENNVTALFTTYCSANSMNYDDSRVSNACFYVGFNEVIRTSVTLTHLTKDIDKTLEVINENKNSATPTQSVPLDMQASVDALAWATGQTPPYPNKSAVTGTPVTIKGTQYKHVVVDLNQSGKIFYRLADKDAPSPTSSTLITDGYCDANGSKTPCEGIENQDGSINMSDANATICYACPVTFDDTANTSVTDLLVDALNNGTDSIISISDDPDIEQSVKDFKKEITGDENGTVTIDNIIEYINANK